MNQEFNSVKCQFVNRSYWHWEEPRGDLQVAQSSGGASSEVGEGENRQSQQTRRTHKGIGLPRQGAGQSPKLQPIRRLKQGLRQRLSDC